MREYKSDDNEEEVCQNLHSRVVAGCTWLEKRTYHKHTKPEISEASNHPLWNRSPYVALLCGSCRDPEPSRKYMRLSRCLYVYRRRDRIMRAIYIHRRQLFTEFCFMSRIKVYVLPPPFHLPSKTKSTFCFYGIYMIYQCVCLVHICIIIWICASSAHIYF